MNNSQIDVLLQLPIPRTEPVPPARPRDDASVFDNHFRQASDTGSVSAQPPARSQQQSETSGGKTERRSPAHGEPPRQAQAQSSSRPAAEAESQDAAAVAEEAQAINESRDDPAPEDSAAAVAALLAAQQLAAATPADADSKLQPAAEIAPAESAPAQPHAAVAKQQPRAKGAKQAAQQPASAAKSEHPSLPAEATPADAESNADQAKADAKASAAKPQDLALRSATHATQESTPDKSVEPKDNVKASRAETARDHGPQPEVAASKSAAKSAAAQAAGAAPISEPSRASKKPAVESSRDDVPKKGDKRSAARTFAVSGEAASSAAERPANAARTADTPPMPTVATGAPQQLPVAEVTVASSANANTSSKDSAAAKQGLLSPFARLERGVHGTRGGQRSASGEPARHVDPARFVSRVARAIHTAQERGGPLQLRLSPPELGAMRLELAVNQGALTATIETDNSTTRQLLLDHLPALRERLAEQNVKIERFDVDVRRDPGGGQQNAAPQDRGNQHHQRTSTPQAASRRDAAPPVTDPSQPIRRSITNTSINVVA